MLCAKRVTVCCCLAVALALALIGPSRGGEGKQAPSVFSASEARTRAAEVTGLSAKAIQSASRRTVTDVSAPFEIRSLPVWEVAFGGVKLGENRKIGSLRVWLDSRDGTLVKVFSPHPREGGLELVVGPEEREGLEASGVRFTKLSTPPKLPLGQVLAHQQSGMLTDLPQAREVVAYYGLYCDRLPEDNPVVDRPAWFVYLGGIKHALPSGPMTAPSRGAFASEMLAAVDAVTGQQHTALYTGRPTGVGNPLHYRIKRLPR